MGSEKDSLTEYYDHPPSPSAYAHDGSYSEVSTTDVEDSTYLENYSGIKDSSRLSVTQNRDVKRRHRLSRVFLSVRNIASILSPILLVVIFFDLHKFVLNDSVKEIAWWVILL